MKAWPAFALLALFCHTCAVYIVFYLPWTPTSAAGLVHTVLGAEAAAVIFFTLAMIIGWFERKGVRK